MKKNKKGFTLTELIIVIVIIGILAAVLIPSITGYIKKAKISKGTQNARNITTLVTGEVLFNDEEFLLPNEVVAIAKESGYDLVSEVEGYAYWYNTDNNSVIFESFDGAIGAAASSGRSRVEAIAPAHENWLYIDQTPNAIKNAIDTINGNKEKGIENIVENAKRATGYIGTKTRHDEILAEQETVIGKIDEIIKSQADNIRKMKGLNQKVINNISQYIETFDTNTTLYIDGTTRFNRQLVNMYAAVEGDIPAGQITVERAMIVDGVTSITSDSKFDSVEVNLLAPLIIQGEVNNVATSFLKTFISGVILLSANSNIDTSNFNENVTIGSLANIKSIKYYTLTPKFAYTKKEYRLTNGTIYCVDADEELRINENGVLYVYKKSDETYRAYEVEETNKYRKYTINSNTKEKEYYDGLLSFNKETQNKIKDVLLSEYLIPTITIDKTTIDFDRFITADGTKGNITIRSTVSPFSTRFTAVLVDENYVGYKLDNVGYINDTIINIDQTKKNDDGTESVWNNTKAVISCKIPDDAQSFTNLKNVTVKIKVRPMYVQYTDYKYDNTTGGQTTLKIPTGNIYKGEISDDYTLTGNSFDGFTVTIEDLTELIKGKYIETLDANGETIEEDLICNQIEIAELQICDKDDDGNERILYTRYYQGSSGITIEGNTNVKDRTTTDTE